LFVERARRDGLATAIRASLRTAITSLRRLYLVRFWRMNIGEDCRVSLSAKLDKTNPRGVHIGPSTAINFRACVLTHDYTREIVADTRIGRECQIGGYAIIMPGVTIGNNCVVAPASVVMRDVPANSLVSGNPARVMQRDIRTGRWGKLIRDPVALAGATAPAAA
jgi:acetyltransferase-like isoleucine patch superfamily enzyme